MAHKSKTQRAKASATKANRKDRQERDELAKANAPEEAEESTTESKGGLFKKKADTSAEKTQVAAAAKKEEKKKPKSTRFQFFKDVRAEMKRVTWPTRQDVQQWTGVVVGALVFFGVYVAFLDNVVITNALIAITGLGA